MLSIIERAPKTYARVAGVMYLLIIAAGLFAHIAVVERLTVASDAAATATNIQTHAGLWRLGIAADLTTYAMAIPVTLILYVLLRPVNRDLALLSVFFNLVQDAVGAMNAVGKYRPLQLLGDANYLDSIDPALLQAMALQSIDAQSIGFAVALLFFGVYCVALGYLIYKSGIMSRIVGVMMFVAGLCYVINSLAVLLSPATAAFLFPWILLPPFVGELTLALWLTVKGVKVPARTKQPDLVPELA